MANPALNDVYRHITVCQDNQQGAYLTRYWKVTAVATVGAGFSESDLADALSTALAPLYKPLMYNNASYRGCTVQRIDGPPPLLRPVVSQAGQGVGTGGATGLPKQASGIISFYGASTGRESQGRQYVPFPATAHAQADGYCTNAYVGNLALLLAALAGPQTFINGGGSSVTIKPGFWNYPNSRFTDITNGAARTIFATQKRRGDYGRTNPVPF